MFNRTRTLARAVVTAAAMLIAASSLGAQDLEDVVYLNDGSILRGVITEQIPGQSILIKTRDGNVFRITMDRIQRMTRETRPNPAPNNNLAQVPQEQWRGYQEKSPGTAFLLSFLIPGAGQAYNGQYGKGAIQFAATAVGTALTTYAWSDCWEYDECADWTVGLVLLVSGRLWSAIDAPASANAINRRMREGRIALDLGPRLTVATASPAVAGLLRDAGLPSTRVNLGFGRITF